MTRASSICWALLAAFVACVFLVQPGGRPAAADRHAAAATVAAITASECHVYSYQRDIIVTRPSSRRLAYRCSAVDARERDT